MKLVNSWYSLDILPLYLLLSEEKLQTALQQLDNLKQEDCPTDGMLKRIIKLQEQQSKTAWVTIEQCKRWRRQNPDQDQIINIIQLTRNTRELVKINQRILSLASNMRDKDVNSAHDARAALNALLIAHGWE